jgi:hypothetical protein
MQGAIDAKQKAVDAGKANYIETEMENHMIEMKEDQYYQRNFGIEKVWDAMWDFTTSMIGVTYNHQQGYWFYHFGHCIGSGLADLYIMEQWALNYTAL